MTYSRHIKYDKIGNYINRCEEIMKMPAGQASDREEKVYGKK